jgi:periplasmic protein TonB
VFQTIREIFGRQFKHLRDRRLAGATGALLIELLLLLVVLSLGMAPDPPKKPRDVLTSISSRKTEEQAERENPEPAKASRSLQPPRPVPTESLQRSVPAPSAVIIPLPKNDMAKFDISNLPRQPQSAPSKPMMGPPDTGSPGDSKRVGTAPNGEPMYAAAWYREPYEDELRGYLSTATGPGWALITCRTAPDFRVEDCVGLDEWPDNSQIQRAVLAAAWQFRVRPPRVGGVSRVGEWVRIRIDYTQRER